MLQRGYHEKSAMMLSDENSSGFVWPTTSTPEFAVAFSSRKCGSARDPHFNPSLFLELRPRKSQPIFMEKRTCDAISALRFEIVPQAVLHFPHLRISMSRNRVFVVLVYSILHTNLRLNYFFDGTRRNLRYFVEVPLQLENFRS